MTDDLVKRLRRDLASGLSASIGDTEKAADRIECLEEALLTALGMLSEIGLSSAEKCELAYEFLLERLAALGEKKDGNV